MKRTSGWPALHLALFLGLVPAAVPAAGTDPARLRASAERLGAWAVETERPEALASAIDVLLAHGATLGPDDPWRAADMLDALARMPRGDALAAAIRDRQDVSGRGVTSGVTRVELTLAPGTGASFELAFQAREIADVEVRLKRGSDLADVDLRLLDGDGAVLSEDTGPETGRPGYGLYVEWMPQTCVTARAELVNVGSGDARLVMLTQPSRKPQCDE